MRRKAILGLIIVILSCCTMYAQQVVLSGIVSDSITGEPLSYANVVLKGTTLEVVTDKEGHFSFNAPSISCTLQIHCLGYESRELLIIPEGKAIKLDVCLLPTAMSLNEVTAGNLHEKYRKKKNPAVEFVRHVIASRNKNNPRNHDYFSYDQYEKQYFAKYDYTTMSKKQVHTGKYDFLCEFVDTLENGITILPVSEKEKVQTIYYRRSPQSEKQVVRGCKSSGIDEIFSSDGVQQFLGEVFREVDIFQNDISLFLQRFVSPLSSIGPDYYKYYLMDTLQVNGKNCVDLEFEPFNPTMFGFTGHLYVTLDSTYFVKRVVLHIPKDINLNYVSRLTINQEFERALDSTRIITKDDISVYFKMTARTKEFYARCLNIYTNHSFDSPTDDEIRFFRESAPVITLQGSHRQTEEFWNTYRPFKAEKQTPKSTDKLMAKLNTVPTYRITVKTLTMLFSGYLPTHREPEKSKFEFGPMDFIIDGNTLEGTRFRLGGTTTTAFNKHLFFDGYLAYGIDDKKMKYDGLVEYSFNERKKFRKEFPMHSLRLEYTYDINKLGQECLYNSKDYILLMIHRKKDPSISYQRLAELTYTREHYNGISYNVIVRNRREYATHLTNFQRIEVDGTVVPVNHYDMTALELRFRYAHNEKFYQSRNQRIPIAFDALIFNASHVISKKNFLGSDYNYHRTDIGLQKRFWLSTFGYIDIIAKAGKVWTKVPYPLLILPKANLTYTTQPESYTNINAMEFINDEYASWDLTYYMNGNLLNRLPLIKKLRWREVFCFRGMWGHLTGKNNLQKTSCVGLFRFPSYSYIIGNTPYMETSIGIENIFNFLRIDYVWRLSYLNHPNIQKSGVRITMALSF